MAAAIEKSNRELALEFMRLITEGFFAEPIEGDDPNDPEFQSHMLQRTKAWRREVWKKFYEVEERLCPRPQTQPRPDYVKMITAKPGR